jgi:hypothetical protein
MRSSKYIHTKDSVRVSAPLDIWLDNPWSSADYTSGLARRLRNKGTCIQRG